MLVTIMVILLFIILGFIFCTGKGSPLLIGKFNDEKYNKIAVGKFFGKITFLWAFLILVLLLSGNHGIKWLSDAAMVLFVGSLMFTIIYPNTGNRFKK